MDNKKATKSNQNLMGALTYLLGFITGIIFLVIEKENKFIRFHAMQSVIVFGGLFVLQIVLGFVPGVGPVVGGLVSLASLVLWVLLMIKAFNGEMYKLPYVGEIAAQKV